MYNLLIVDDEQTIRTGLKKTVDWESMGIRIVGDVRHGQEALDFLEINLVHIVLTDLKMPIMDGLMLTEKINNLYPEIKTVILTGYSDFEYARTAIKNGVQDYLLKPLNLNKLNEVINSLTKVLDEETANQEHSLLNSYIVSGAQMDLRYSYLMKYAEKKTLTNREIKSLETLGFPQIPKACRILLCDPNEIENDNIENLHFCAEILEESWKEARVLMPFISQNQKLAILVGEEIDPIKILETLSHIGDQSFRIGIGSIGQNWAEIKDSFLEAAATYRARPLFDAPQILYYDDLPTQFRKTMESTPQAEISIEEFVLKLPEYIIEQDFTRALSCLNEISTTLKKTLLDFKIFRQEMVKIVVLSSYYLMRNGISLGDFKSNYSDLLSISEKLKNADQVQHWVQGIISDFCSQISNEKKLKYNPLVHEAISHMKLNYKEALRIESVANLLEISPNYLSRIFKEETGLSFLNWLNTYRIKESESLLKNTKLKIYEISDKVGFSDYRYFNKVFKKQNDMSPLDFRKKGNSLKSTHSKINY